MAEGAEEHSLRVSRAERWRAGRLSADMRRGGGTSFVDLLAQAARVRPSIAVILTDLDGPFGPKPPFPVIWAIPQTDTPRPPFGKVLSMAA